MQQDLQQLFCRLFPAMVPCLNCAGGLELRDVVSLLVKAGITEVHIDTVCDGFTDGFAYTLHDTNRILKTLPIRAEVHVWPYNGEWLPMELELRPEDLLSVHIPPQNSRKRMLESLLLISEKSRIGIVIESYQDVPVDILSSNLVTRISVLAGPIGSRGVSLTRHSVDTIKALGKFRENITHRHLEIAIDGGVNTTTLETLCALPLDHIIVGSILFGSLPNLATLTEKLSWAKISSSDPALKNLSGKNIYDKVV